MNNNLISSGTIQINASVQKVWLGLTTPEIIKQYLFGTETLTDWKPGSEIIFKGEYQGQKYRDKGIVQENKLHEKLSYLYWSGFSGDEDKLENYSLVTYSLKHDAENKTTFTWSQKGFVNETNCAHSQNGMKAFLEIVKAVIEKN